MSHPQPRVGCSGWNYKAWRTGSYPGRQLSTWAHRLAERARDGQPVYVYFNNDPGAVAVEHALTMRSILRKLVQ